PFRMIDPGDAPPGAEGDNLVWQMDFKREHGTDRMQAVGCDEKAAEIDIQRLRGTQFFRIFATLHGETAGNPRRPPFDDIEQTASNGQQFLAVDRPIENVIAARLAATGNS